MTANLADRVEGLKRDTIATTDALLERLARAEHIIATIAVNCQRTSDPVVLVQTLAVLDFAGWLDTGVYAEPPAALRAKGGDDPHSDDLAVDRFAAAMKTKLAQKRAEGRGGWDDKDACSGEWLSRLLRGHVEKGDPVDVANFAMMLHQRGERIAP